MAPVKATLGLVAEAEQRTPRHGLTVGYVVGVSPDKWARVWQERMPRMRLMLDVVDEGAVISALESGCDMVLARLPLADTDLDLHSIPLWEETPVVVVPKDHPIKLFDSVDIAELSSENVLDGADDAALDLVAAGVGVVRMPQAVFRATGRRDVVARPLDGAEPTRIALVWRADRDDEATQEFVGVVRGRTARSSRSEGTPPVPKAEARRKPAAKGTTAKASTKGRQPARGKAPKRRGRG